MRKIIFISFSLFLSQLGVAQYAAVKDSFMAVLKHNKAEDTNRVKTLLNLSYTIVYDRPDSSMNYADEAMELSEKLKWQKGIAGSFRQKGLVYYTLSDNVNSMDYYLKALKAGRTIHSEIFDASLYNNIANIYADLQDYNKALDYYSKYLSISRKLKSKIDEVRGLNNMGNVYFELNNEASGISFFNEALAISEEMGNKSMSASIYNNLGAIFLKRKNYTSALNNFEKSYELANESGNKNIKATALNGIAEIYLNQNKYSQAEDYSKRSLQISKEVNDLSWQVNALETLSEIYEKEKNYKNSLNTFKQALILKDSGLSNIKAQKITRMEMQYQFDKQQALNKATADKNRALAAAEINRQKVIRNASIGLGGLLLLIAVAGIVLYKRRKELLEKKRESEFNVLVTDTEMKALRAQMNPHFIFNSLNSINDYIDKHDSVKATLYTTKFAKLMRMILENSEQKEIPIAEDLKALELYMQLEALRMNNKFTYEIKVDENIDQDNTLIPPLILQPFVENSIWHGFAQKQGEGKILIYIHKDGNMISCIVEDNGNGKDESAYTKAGDNTGKKSLGMKITKARIDIINSLKKSNAAVTTSYLEEGTKIEVKLPEALLF